jgi:hypothetical protein
MTWKFAKSGGRYEVTTHITLSFSSRQDATRRW